MSPAQRTCRIALAPLPLLLLLGCGAGRVSAPAATNTPAPVVEDAFSVGACDSAVVASTTAGGIVRTTDGGRTWVVTDRTNVRGFAAIGSTLFSAANGGVLVSHDAGLHWTRVSSPMLPNESFWSFAVVGDRVLVIGTFHGVFRSGDLGVHWASASSGLPDAQVGRIAVSNGVLVALVGLAAYRSTDGGDTWILASDLPTSFPFGFAAGSGSFYIADAFGPVYVSHDNAATWSRTANDLPGAPHNSRAIVLGNDLYLPTDQGLWRTADDGGSWQHLDVGGEPLAQVNDLALHDGSLFAATDGLGVQRSDDGGVTWTRVHPTGGGLP